jgi:hypothetical protein
MLDGIIPGTLTNYGVISALITGQKSIVSITDFKLAYGSIRNGRGLT